MHWAKSSVRIFLSLLEKKKNCSKLVHFISEVSMTMVKSDDAVLIMGVNRY